MTANLLAFGASGKFAGLVVPALKARGLHVRGFVREEKDADTAREHGTDEVALGDLTDRASIERALEGIDRVFYIAPAFMAREAEVGRSVVDACVAAGVKRFVFSSVIHPVLSGLSNHSAKQPVEEAILDSGMTYALLHPALYFQNYLQSWPKVVETGVLAEPWSCDTRFSRVDYRDVAEVAAIALAEDRLNYGTFELCSDGWLNRHDVADLIGKVLGRDIRAERIDPAMLGDQAKPMRPMFDHYEQVGLRGNPLTLRAILGREPRRLDAFFAELASDGGDH
ncbi:NmrA family NAD(P)-binding protein [Novosphingobium sp.]|uniref:NmrA family NAD(P)-binding protein n=1 Tax=Novosphingobium sp. TaxID=1874826 RepID=UPI002FDE97B3